MGKLCGDFKGGAAMNRTSRHIQALGTALLAVAAFLSAVGEASACSTGGKSRGGKPAPACCRARTVCGCCKPASAAASAPKPALPAVSQNGANARLAAEPDAPCVCRPGLPTPPARAPEADGTVRPDDRAERPAASVAAELRPVSARFPSPGTAPLPFSTGPVYLRTGRLLI